MSKTDMVIFITGLIAGSLDFLAAILLFLIVSKQHPSVLLKSISSAALGPAASTGGTGMALLGLGIHYLIAMSWTLLYFAIFPKIMNARTPVLTHAVCYGLIVWVIMNLVVLPLSKAAPRPFSANMALINILILILAIGLPCAYAAARYPEARFGF